MKQRAFAIVELVSIAAILLVLAAVLILSSGDSRRRARLAGSISNLQEYAVGTQAYAADSMDRFWTFSWRAGVDYGFGGIAGNDNDAEAHQAVEILRRRGGRSDIDVITGWFPHLWYSHLVLADYLDRDLLDPVWASPGDLNRLGWRRDPIAYLNLPNRPNYPGITNTEKKWPYSSSYEVGPAFDGPDAAIGQVATIAQDPQSHRNFTVGTPETRLGQRRIGEVAFPAQKAMVFEENQYFFGDRTPVFLYSEARVPVLFADGGASIRAIGNANLGFQPNTPLNPFQTRVNYSPDLAWESPALNGFASQIIDGHIRWTRSGLRGRDFGGPEVPWSPP